MTKCPWCFIEVTEPVGSTPYIFHISGECVGNKYRQLPHPFGKEWNNWQWREDWLNGMSDDELDLLDDEQKKEVLPAYVYICSVNSIPYELYGEQAVLYLNLAEAFEKVNKDIPNYDEFQLYLSGRDMFIKKLKSKV